MKLVENLRLRQLRELSGAWRMSIVMMTNDHWPALVAKLSARLQVKSETFIMHPAELSVLRSITDKELRQFAAAHGWRVIRRVGGRQIEFYNDTSTRSAPISS